MENIIMKRKHWTAKRKIAVVLEGLKEKETVGELCRKHGISQSMYYEWRTLLLQKGEDFFRHGGKTPEEAEKDKRIAQLERKLGQLTLENDLLKKVETWRGTDGRRLNGSGEREAV